MLVLSRKVGESLLIGDNITIVIHRMAGNRVTLAIEAPKEVRVVRAELIPYTPPGQPPTLEGKEESHLPPPGYRPAPPKREGKYTQCVGCGRPLTKGQKQCQCGRGTPVGT